MICEHVCLIRKMHMFELYLHTPSLCHVCRLTGRLKQPLTSAVCNMAEVRVHKVPLTTESSGETESESESKGCKRTRPPPDVAHTPTSPADSPSAASAEGTPEVACNPNPGVRLIENTERFKDMPLGEKYEGKYQFMNVDQADEEISFLTGEVEGLKADIKKYNKDHRDTVTRYRDANYECRSLSEDIGRLQEDLRVQGHIMETAKKEGTKLEEKIAECKERMGELETQLEYAREARHE